jgi:xylulokinase
VTYLMGIGTSTKALLTGEAGRVLGVAASEYTYDTPQPLWSEQHPGLWWQATVLSIRQVLAQGG